MDFTLTPKFAMDLFLVSLTILIAYIVSRVFRSFIQLPENVESRRRETYATILRSVVTSIIYIIALHVIFGILEINIAPLLASAGILGLSIGMGAKGLIEDLIAGTTLLSQDSIAIGDDVEIDGSVGKIEKIGFRTLNIRAKDGSLHIIPNGMVKKVINYSRSSEKSKASAGSKKA